MKHIILFVLILFLNICFCQSNAQSIIIKNKVKEVRVFNFKNKLVSVSKFDNNGRLTFESKDNYAGSAKITQTNFYDKKNNLIKIISTHSSYAQPTIWQQEYDDNNNLKSIKDQNGNLVFEYFYDNSNFKTKQLSYRNGKISDSIIYEKQNNGGLLVWYMNGEFIQNRKNLEFFDENNNEVRSESYNDGKLHFYCDNIYENNKKIKTIYNGKSGNNYYYDNKNRLIKREQFDIENEIEIPDKSELFQYYNNDLIENYSENIYSIRGEKYRFEYVFYR